MQAKAVALILFFCVAAAEAQEKFEVKVANFIPAQHFVSKWLVTWGEKLEKSSGARLVFKHFPGGQMGPAPAHYDLSRNGQAEISLFLHGATPGRFPLSELTHLPYVVGSAEIGTKVINDSKLRSTYLDAEHRGVKVLLLFTHQPGNVFTTAKPIRAIEDMKGMRIRFASSTIRDFIATIGGAPIGVPSGEQLEQLQKGVIDGTFIDYGGAGIAFKMAGTIKYATEMYSFVSSFGLAMNPQFHDRLPEDLRKLIANSLVAVEKEVGSGFDATDDEGKAALVKGGAEAIRLSKDQDSKFRQAGMRVTEEKLKELEAKSLPARKVYALIQSLSEQHAKTSKSFWH
jgi:TRAP-type C4-dicarboxylate transport system substrate-binding protein